MSQFENLQFSPELKPKKTFDWWRLIFNAIWISVVVFLFTLASLSFFAYWNVYRSIPTDKADFFVIFDKKFYEKNENWQKLGDDFASHYLQLETDIWRALLAEGQYFWGVYWEDSADIKAKLVLFSYTTLPDELFVFLEQKGVSYVYEKKILLLNSDQLEQRKNTLPSLFMANNLCFGKFKGDRFSCDNNNNFIKITVDGQDYKNNGQMPDVFNLDSLANGLWYADNQLDYSGLPANIRDNWLQLFPFLENQNFSLLLWNRENTVFSNDFALFLTNIDSRLLLSDLQYHFAYQNRQTRETVLADGSRYSDEVLDVQGFSWQDYQVSGLSVSRLLLKTGSEDFLYAYPFSENLILTNRLDLLSPQNLFLSEDFSRVTNFSYRKILMGKLSWEKFLTFPLTLENCENLKIEYQVSNYDFSLCD